MYKAKHDLSLKQKYLIWYLGIRQKRIGEEEGEEEEEEEEEKRRKKEGEEEQKGKETMIFVWITMGLYGLLWLGMTISCNKPRV